MDTPALTAGDRVGDRYTVIGPLGQGGLGQVYEVSADALGNRLALKLIHPHLLGHRTLKARLTREAHIQASLQHPGVTRVFDFLDAGGVCGFVMELVRAPTLRQRLDEGALELPQIEQLLRELLSTLQACHDAAIAHRDLKPDNIFVMEDAAGRVRSKLADFGIAKELEAEGPALTRSEGFMGTYAYASPEQIASAASVDTRTDLYSLGVIAWELLSGVRPYADIDSAFDIQTAVVHEDLPQLPASVPGPLRRLVVELTRKDPAERPQSAAEALGILDAGEVDLDGRTVAEATPAAVGARRTGPPPSPATIAETGTPKERARARLKRLTERRREALSHLVPAQLQSRLVARGVEELTLQLLVLSCVGVWLYPIFALWRGTSGAPSIVQGLFRIRLYDAASGAAASPRRIFFRNLFDLCTYQSGLVALAFWPAWPSMVVPVGGGLWAGSWISLELLLAWRNPHGRRLADRLCRTRMCNDA